MLLDDSTLRGYVNQVNNHDSYLIDARYLLHRVADIEGGRIHSTGEKIPLRNLHYLVALETNTADPTVGRIQLRNSLPPQYASRVLARPIEGRVTQINAPTDGKPFELRMTTNLGTHHGVFVGMRLYIGDRRLDAVVEQVDAESCIVTAAKVTGWNDPVVGTRVSSSRMR